MAEEIKIEIDVEDSTAMAKLAELQAQLDKLGGPQGAGGMKAGIRVSQIFGADLEKMAAAGGRYKQVMDEVAQSTAGVTGATNELAQETQKAGINIESMMTRMVARMAVFEAVRLGFKMLTDEFKEVVGFEAARVGFEAMTIGAKDATEAEKIMEQTAKETGIDHEKLYAAVISLENAGEGPKAAAQEVENLGKFAAATHGDVDKMSKALSDVRLGTASVQEMFDLAHRTGEAKDEMVGLVAQYANLQKEIARTDHARAEELATMREQAAVTERAIADQQKLAGVQEGFLEKMLGAEGKPPAQADPVLARAMQPGGLPQTAGGAQMTKEIQLGFQQIYQEEGLTTEGMQHFVDTGVIGMRDIMAAAKRMHEAEKEARTSAIEGLAKEDAAAKKGEKVDLDQKRLELADKFSAAINDQANAEGIYAKWAATAEGSMALAAAHAKDIREHSEQALVASKGIARLWGAMQPGGEQPGFWSLPAIGGNVMMGRQREAVLGGAAPGGKVGVKEDNSDESVRLLRGILNNLSGQGTP
jgi:hypothetical protein